ncbi:hypothetical protein FPV67DRAFT_1677025 [Lyophyllum atratum]|nr:hypothetical protein FPV67DRAFT_1677025 [Lyophyllum atratum]
MALDLNSRDEVVPHRKPIGDTALNFDKRHGRLQRLDGNLFYSPNCSRTILAPIPPDEAYGRDYTIFHRTDARPELYHQPRWWTLAFGWISCIPLYPSYTGGLFKRLAYVPRTLNMYNTTDNKELGYSLPDSVQDSWARLDKELAATTSIIAAHYKIGLVRPFSPWALGYLKESPKHAQAVGRAFRSRDWFSIWMGLASHLIATAESRTKPGDMDWSELLRREGYEQTWIDALKSSTICDFSAMQAGTIIDLRKPDNDRPTIQWFCEHNIPVWYKWGASEVNDERLKDFAPLDEHHHKLAASQGLCAAVTATPQWLEGSGSGYSSYASSDSTALTTVYRQSSPLFDFTGGVATPQWMGESQVESDMRTEGTVANSNVATQAEPPRAYIVWFAAREERNKARLLKETPQARQTRLNRERIPPRTSAKVFVWEPSPTEPSTWVRVPVRVDEREETLDDYGDARCRYNSFNNEWDCCEEFGPRKPEDDMESNPADLLDGLDDDELSLGLLPRQIASVAQRALTPPPRPALSSDAEHFDYIQFHHTAPTLPVSSADAWQQEVLEILSTHYGFTPPLPIPTTIPAPTREVDRKKLIRHLGLRWSECKDHISVRPIAGLAKSYLDAMVLGTRPSDNLCDFNTQSRVSLAGSGRLQFLRIVKEAKENGVALYMFDFGKHSKAAWKLTLRTAADALMVCRLDQHLDEYELARYLLTRGIPFHTLLPSPLALHVPPEAPPPCVLPVRLSGAVFSQNDYNVYVTQRMAILSQPRARAALLRGGYIWRFSVATLSFESVLNGPRGLNPTPGAMFIAEDPKTNQTFIDDSLTEIELNLLSGTYVCHTGIHTQTSHRSWWPMTFTFEGSGEDYSRWNIHREDAFIARLDEIKKMGQSEASRGPMTATKWRDLMRGNKDTRHLKENLERWSATFIQEQLHPS